MSPAPPGKVGNDRSPKPRSHDTRHRLNVIDSINGLGGGRAAASESVIVSLSQGPADLGKAGVTLSGYAQVGRQDGDKLILTQVDSFKSRIFDGKCTKTHLKRVCLSALGES